MSPKAILKQKQEDSPLGNPPAFTSVHQALQLLRGKPAQENGILPAVEPVRRGFLQRGKVLLRDRLGRGVREELMECRYIGDLPGGLHFETGESWHVDASRYHRVHL